MSLPPSVFKPKVGNLQFPFFLSVLEEKYIDLLYKFPTLASQ